MPVGYLIGEAIAARAETLRAVIERQAVPATRRASATRTPPRIEDLNGHATVRKRTAGRCPGYPTTHNRHG